MHFRGKKKTWFCNKTHKTNKALKEKNVLTNHRLSYNFFTLDTVFISLTLNWCGIKAYCKIE